MRPQLLYNRGLAVSAVSCCKRSVDLLFTITFTCLDAKVTGGGPAFLHSVLFNSFSAE